MAGAGGELVRAAEWRRVREFVTGAATRAGGVLPETAADIPARSVMRWKSPY